VNDNIVKRAQLCYEPALCSCHVGCREKTVILVLVIVLRFKYWFRSQSRIFRLRLKSASLYRWSWCGTSRSSVEPEHYWVNCKKMISINLM